MRKEFAEFVFHNENKPYSENQKEILKRLSNYHQVNFFTVNSPKFIRELLAEKVKVNIYEFRGSFSDLAEENLKEAKVFFNENLEFEGDPFPVVVCLDFLNYSEDPINTVRTIKRLFPQSEVILGFDIDMFTGVNVDEVRYIFMGANGNIPYRRFNDSAVSAIAGELGGAEVILDENYVFIIDQKDVFKVIPPVEYFSNKPTEIKEEVLEVENNVETALEENEEVVPDKKKVIKKKNKGD
jgi:hypothetical protein